VVYDDQPLKTMAYVKKEILFNKIAPKESSNSGTAHFVDQIEVSGGKGGFIKSGDSSSLLGTPGRQPVGLLFARERGG